jgi:hypothetical protein
MSDEPKMNDINITEVAAWLEHVPIKMITAELSRRCDLFLLFEIREGAAAMYWQGILRDQIFMCVQAFDLICKRAQLKLLPTAENAFKAYVNMKAAEVATSHINENIVEREYKSLPDEPDVSCSNDQKSP